MKIFFDWFSQKIQDKRFVLMILGIVTVITFFNILPNEFVMDDYDFIVNWELIQDIKNLPRFFIGYITPESQVGIYSPLRTLVFSLNYLMFGDTPLGWHIVSMIIHFLGVWAIYCLTHILMGDRNISFLTALIFAVHPVHVEAITAVTGSIDTLGVVLGLWSVYWYIRCVLVKGTTAVFFGNGFQQLDSRAENIDRRMYVFSLILGMFAMFTHELILTLPIIIFVCDVFFLEPRFSWKKSLVRTLPFLGVLMVYVFLKYDALGGIARGGYAFDNMYLTFFVIIKSWAKYLGVLIFPAVLTHNKIISHGIMSFDAEDFNRASFFAQSWRDPQIALSFILLAGILLLGFFYYRRKPLFSFCIFWFYITLLPVSQIIPTSVYYGERYLYLGSLAYCLSLSLAFFLVYKKLAGQMVYKTLVVILMTGIIGAYGIRTIVRNHDWRDEVSFFEKAIQLNPESSSMKNDLGLIYLNMGDLASAKKYFLQAIAIQPNNAYFYFSLSSAYASLGEYDAAVESLKKAIHLDPDFSEAYFNLVGVTDFMGEEEQSLVYLNKAIQLWKKRGKTLEAGEAVEAFYIYLADKKGDLKQISGEDFLKEHVED